MYLTPQSFSIRVFYYFNAFCFYLKELNVMVVSECMSKSVLPCKMLESELSKLLQTPDLVFIISWIVLIYFREILLGG